MVCPRCGRFLIGVATITVFRSLLVTDCGTSASCAIDVLLFSTIFGNKIVEQTTINMLVCPMNPLVSGNLLLVSSKKEVCEMCYLQRPSVRSFFLRSPNKLLLLRENLPNTTGYLTLRKKIIHTNRSGEGRLR